MLGKNLLWVAKQHGHSVQTMLDVYAAWIEGSKESDLEAIRQPMESSPRARVRVAGAGGVGGTGAASVPSRSTSSGQGPSVTDASRAGAGAHHQPPEFGTGPAPI